jgi:hypothetical protein
MIGRSSREIWRRIRQVRKLWREGGRREVLNRVRRAVANRIVPISPPHVVRLADVLVADVSKPKAWPVLPVDRGAPITVNWVITPPAQGSGGHTTIFRLIQYLERSNYQCRVYIYDVHGSSSSYLRSHVKGLFPQLIGPVADVTEGMADAHAIIATAWQTAYPVYNDPCQGKRFYLVQDFEPWFYPAGTETVLAENTYRMGFHALTAGKFLASKLAADYGMAADAFEFGCDTDKYHLLKGSTRDGVVFYAKPTVPRRAFELGIMALKLFAERYPHLTIHLYGSRVGHLPFPYVDHGVLQPSELNRIYNRCFAGLSLSMTNVSLVPHEMLSAGCIPVVNDAQHNRIVLNNPFVRYALPTPHSLAESLSEVVNTSNFALLASSASASVSSMPWESAGLAVDKSIRRALCSGYSDEASSFGMRSS